MNVGAVFYKLEPKLAKVKQGSIVSQPTTIPGSTTSAALVPVPAAQTDSNSEWDVEELTAGLRELRINKSRLEKGYAKVVEKLRTLGAGISEIEVEELRTHMQNTRGGRGNYNSGYSGGSGRNTGGLRPNSRSRNASGCYYCGLTTHYIVGCPVLSEDIYKGLVEREGFAWFLGNSGQTNTQQCRAELGRDDMDRAANRGD